MEKHCCNNCIYCARDKDKIYYCANEFATTFEDRLVIKDKYKNVCCQLFESV